MKRINEYRELLKTYVFTEMNEIKSDQDSGVTQPPIQKEYKEDAEIIDLVNPKEFKISNINLLDAINGRRSRRAYSDQALTNEELSFLLWVTQGVQRVVKGGYATLRTVPSGGARHSFETYLFINRVEGLKQGIYRYLPLEHKLVLLETSENLSEKVSDACFGQSFVGKGAVIFAWATVPYRMEWRYGIAAHKTIALDAGHLCQNLYLACEAINAGACGIGAYDQDKIDKLLGIDGNEEFTIYVAPVGKRKSS